MFGNEGVDVAVEGIQLYNWCSQSKPKKCLGHVSGEVGVDADRNLCGSEEHLGLAAANLFIKQQWGLIDRELSSVLGFAPGPELLSCFSHGLDPEPLHQNSSVWSLLIQKVIYLLVSCCAEQ